MADKTIVELTDAATLDGTETLHVVQAANSREATAANIAALSSGKGQHTIWLPGGAMVPATTSGAVLEASESTTNKVMIDGLLFDAATSESAQVAVQMPKSWDEGTLVAQFVWTHPATTTNFGVTWGIAAVAFANDDALDTAFGTAVEVSDTGGTTEDCYISPETAAITVAGVPAAEELVMFKIYRAPADASDTMAVDAKLLGVKIHYTTDAETDG